MPRNSSESNSPHLLGILQDMKTALIRSQINGLWYILQERSSDHFKLCIKYAKDSNNTLHESASFISYRHTHSDVQK